MWCLKDLSESSHTGTFLAKELEEIIEQIGAERFSAIVSDAGANIQNARKLIAEKYPNILNVRCIAHSINLISKDICNTPFANKILTRCNTVVTFFKRSHQGGAALKKEAKCFNISGGGLKRWVNTRWHTMFDCVDSIKRYKEVLEKVNCKRFI